MTMQWYFTQMRPGDRVRESQVEKFFRSDSIANRAEAIVREGIQNSLDAHIDDRRPVHVRIVLGELSPEAASAAWKRWGTGLDPHLLASSRDKLPLDTPKRGETLRFLSFEDFGTSGLRGDPTEWRYTNAEGNAFFNFFRAEGISDKAADKRGRHGVGRLVFMFASRVRALFGLTQRAGAPPTALLMGTALLRHHDVSGIAYHGDGWFGTPDTRTGNDGNVLPLTDARTLDDFKLDFKLARKDETGLSIVIPWIEADIDRNALLTAVVGGYFLPILQGRLSVEIDSGNGAPELVTATQLDGAVARLPDAAARDRIAALVKLARAGLSNTLIELNGPPADRTQKWSEACIPEPAQTAIQQALAEGRAITLRAPVSVRAKAGRAPASSSFLIHLEASQQAGRGDVLFIREGILISDVRARRPSGTRALVVIEEGPLATFLGDAENPAHTEWQKEPVKERYTYAPSLIDYVTGSVGEILVLLSRQQTRPDSTFLIDLFSLPADAGTDRQRKKAGTRAGKASASPPTPPPPRPRRWRINRREGGFVIQRGDPGTRPPGELQIRVAYDVRRGSPFAKYDLADFRLESRAIRRTLRGCTELECRDNRLRVRIDDPDFEIAVSGFDTSHRDLYVDARAQGEAASAADAPEEAEDAA